MKLFRFVSPLLYSIPFGKAVWRKHIKGFAEEHLSNAQFGRTIKHGSESAKP